MTKVQKNYSSIDLTKLIMAFLVIAIHTKPFVNFNNSLFQSFFNAITSCAVPFFFMSTGYFLSKKKIDENIHLLKKYIKKYTKLYLWGTIIYLPLSIYNYIVSKQSIIGYIFSFIKDSILIGEHYNAWILWYLLSTVYSLIFILILLKLHLTVKNIFIIGFIIILAAFGLDSLANSNLEPLKKILESSIHNGRLFRGFFFIPAGMVLYQQKNNPLLHWGLFIIGVFGKTVTSGYLSNLFLIPMTIGLFCIVVNYPLKSAPIFSYFRKISAILYFIHLYIWTIYYSIVYQEKTYGPDAFVATSILSLLISLIYIKITEHRKRNRAYPA